MLLSSFGFQEDELCFVESSYFLTPPKVHNRGENLRVERAWFLPVAELLSVALVGETSEAGAHHRGSVHQSNLQILWVSFCPLFSELAMMKSYTHIVQ